MNYENINEIIKLFAKIDSNLDLDKIEKAYIFAYEMHRNQHRKSGEPYIIHPLSVALILAEVFNDTNLVVAGLLHDVIEDTQAGFEDIKKHFGEEIAFIVNGVTKISSLEDATIETKTELDRTNLNKLLLATAKDARVMLVKLADRLHNMQTLRFHKKEKQKEIALETLNIFAPIAAQLGIKKFQSELEDLSFKILNYPEYKKIANVISLKKKIREEIIKRIIKEVSIELDKEKIKYKIFGRSKHFYSIYQKKIKKNIRYEDILDLLAIRIIVDKKEECYIASSIIHSLYKKIRADKDYIQKPKKNGYQSLHITVKDDKNNKIEFQIRTFEMDKYAEIGPAAHLLYKFGEKYAKEGIAKIKEKPYKLDMFSDSIFVFTPMKKIISLPVNATPVDFAFQIHTDIGYHTKEAKVNGKLVPLKTKLRNADVVQIITSKEINCSRDWKKFIVSKKAISKINSYFRKKMAEDAIELGKEIFYKKARKYHIPHKTEKEILQIARTYGFYNLFDFYLSIGRGKTVLSNSGIEKVQLNKKIKEQNEQPDYKNISLGLINNLMIKFAKCCNPKPYDDIVGYITRGRGISIHKKNCKNPGFVFLKKKDKDRIITVTWGNLNNRKTNSKKLKLIIKKNKNDIEKIKDFLGEQTALFTVKRIRNRRNAIIYSITFFDMDSELEFEKIKGKLKEKFKKISFI